MSDSDLGDERLVGWEVPSVFAQDRGDLSLVVGTPGHLALGSEIDAEINAIHLVASARIREDLGELAIDNGKAELHCWIERSSRRPVGRRPQRSRRRRKRVVASANS